MRSVVTDGGGKVPAALNVIEGADRVAAFLAGAVRKGWTDEMSVRFDMVNGLPGLLVSGPERAGADQRVRDRRRRDQGDLRREESRQAETPGIVLADYPDERETLSTGRRSLRPCHRPQRLELQHTTRLAGFAVPVTHRQAQA